MKGWGPKSSICPSKPGKSNFFGGISRHFAGISRKCPKSLRKKKVSVQFLAPSIAGTNGRCTAVQMGGVLLGFPFFKACTRGRYSNTNAGGVLRYKLEVYCQYFSDKLCALGVPEQFPVSFFFYYVGLSFPTVHHCNCIDDCLESYHCCCQVAIQFS